MRPSNWMALLGLCCALGGCPCVQPYDVPEFVEIAANETGFLVPLEGATSKQMKFDSAAQVEQMKVAAKRVQVTHRWVKTGRVWASAGEYIDTVRLVKVDRSPVTREWTASAGTGTKAKDQGIWAESKDSVGFSTGFSVTAMIEESNTALFLYRYQAKSLAEIVDTEVRARTQASVAESAAEYNMSDLRAQKVAIIKALRADIVPFFDQRGITITTVGMFGGLMYENPKVQESIDQVFISQREKEVTAAILEAQRDKNARIEQEAVALANREREIARGIAEGKRLILAVAKEAAQSPVFIEMRRLEVEEARIEKWDGCYPQYFMQMGKATAPALMLRVPTPAALSPVGETSSIEQEPITAAPPSGRTLRKQHLLSELRKAREGHQGARAKRIRAQMESEGFDVAVK